MVRTCSIDGCEDTHKGHGFCKNHLRRWKRYGDPTAGRIRRSVLPSEEVLRQEARQRAHDWYYANRERALANVKAYREADPERKKRLNREYREANRERIDARVKQWCDDNPGRRRYISKTCSHKRRATVRFAQSVGFTQEQWQEKVSYWGSRCWMCGGEWTDMDHVKPVSAGGAHLLCNLRPACSSCNSRKHNRWPYALVGLRQKTAV